MVARRVPPPLVCLAISLAISFYYSAACLQPVDASFPSLLFIPLALGLLGSAVSFLLFNAAERGLRALGRRLLGIGIGLLCGIALALPAQHPRFGQPAAGLVALEGRVASDPRTHRTGAAILALELSAASASAGYRTSARGRQVVFLDAQAAADLSLERGDWVRLEGELTGNPGAGLFLARGGQLQGSASALEAWRSRVRNAITQRLADRSWGGLGAALLLGSRDLLEGGEGQLFTQSGCAHVLALSGMHLAILCGVLAMLLRRPLGLRLSCAVSAAFVVCYVFIAGGQASLVRSALMYLAGAWALLASYPRKALDQLALAFILQLVVWSGSALELSFTLSYLALLGILLFGTLLDESLVPWIPRFVRTPLAASLGAFVATSFVCAASFGELRPIGILASLLVTPPISALLIGSLTYLPLSFLCEPLGDLLSLPLEWLADISLRIVSTGSRFPALATSGPWIPLSLCLAAALLIVYLQRCKEKRKRIEHDAGL